MTRILAAIAFALPLIAHALTIEYSVPLILNDDSFGILDIKDERPELGRKVLICTETESPNILRCIADQRGKRITVDVLRIKEDLQT